MLCLLLTSIVTGVAYAYTAPGAISVWYALKMAALCAATLTISHSWLLERHYKVSQEQLTGKSLTRIGFVYLAL